MLMTKFVYVVHTDCDGYHHIAVNRITDGAQKYFFQCCGSTEGICSFMNSLTDELCEGYWPKKASGVDNWIYRGYNFGRYYVETTAAIESYNRRIEKYAKVAQQSVEANLQKMLKNQLDTSAAKT